MDEHQASDKVHNRSALFWICVLALFTAAVANSMRIAASDSIRETVFEPIDAVNSGALVGAALGSAFTGFAVTLLILAAVLNVIGVKRTLMLGAAAFIGGSVLIVLAPVLATGGGAATLLVIGMVLTGIGWGCAEGAINPLTAALYPEDQTHRLNVLHAWWPAGIVVGGLAGFALKDVGVPWQTYILLIAVPGAALGVWTATQSFPRLESATGGATFGQMIAEPFVRPSFWIFFAIMFLTASAELAPGAWVDVALTHTVGMDGILVLVYVSALMFVMRHFAGALAHRISDMGLLWISTIPAAIGLYLLASANSPTSALIAATVWAVGVAFMWPTMLAAVAYRYPRGGSWTISLIAFAGALAIQFVLPILGGIYDKAKAAKASELAASATDQRVLAFAAEQSFQTVALIPAVLFVIFGLVWAIERKRKLGQPLQPPPAE